MENTDYNPRSCTLRHKSHALAIALVASHSAGVQMCPPAGPPQVFDSGVCSM